MERIALPSELAHDTSPYGSFCRTGVDAWLIDDPHSSQRVWQALQELQPRQLAVDFETTAQRAGDGRIRLVQLGVAVGPKGGPVQWVFDTNGADIAPLRGWFEDPTVEKLIQYAPFEQGWAWRHLAAEISPVFDTCLAWRAIKKALAQLNQQHGPEAVEAIRPHHTDHGAGLGVLCEQLLWFPLPKDEQTSDWSNPQLRSAQLLYAALDVAVLPLLAERIRALVEVLDLTIQVDEQIAHELERVRAGAVRQPLSG